MKVMFSKAVYAEMEKAFGKKDLSKLRKEIITDKNGHRKTVWKKNGEKDEKKQPKGEEKPDEIQHKKRVAAIKAMTKRGDNILFEREKQDIQGMVVAKGDDGVTSKTSSVAYQVLYEDIKKNLSKEGVIDSESFNASNYRNQYMDMEIAKLEKANKGDGVNYFLEKHLPGEEGKEMKRKAEETESRVMKQIKEEGQTVDRYRISGEGANAIYKLERQELHKQIIDEYLSPEKIAKATPKHGEKPKFVILGGRAGAGKSWFTGENGLYNPDEYIVLDADAIKDFLPEYEKWNAGTVHEESSDLNKMLVQKVKELGLNVIIDGTMANAKKSVKQVQEFKNTGYTTSCDYMFTPMQESMKRACSRFKTRSGNYTGRFVPLGIMTGMTENEDAFEAVKGIVDRYSFRDNFKQTNGNPTLITQKGLY